MMFSDQISLSCQVPPWTIEYWKPLTFPNVKSNYYLISSTGRIWNISKNCYQPYHFDKDGYCIASLKDYQNNYRPFKLHRLVAYEFCNPPENFRNLQVNHINLNKSFNYDVNLEWCTNKENKHHAMAHDHYAHAETHGGSLLTNEEVHQICQLLQDTDMNSIEIRDYLKLYHISIESFKNLINQINNHRFYTSISQYYNFKQKRRILTNEEVHQICQQIQEGKPIKEIAENFDLSETAIRKIKRGKNHKDISSQYNF